MAFQPVRLPVNWYLYNLNINAFVNILTPAGTNFDANTNIYSLSCNDTFLSLSMVERIEDGHEYINPLVYNITQPFQPQFLLVNPTQQPIEDAQVFYLDNINRYYISYYNMHVSKFNQTDM